MSSDGEQCAVCGGSGSIPLRRSFRAPSDWARRDLWESCPLCDAAVEDQEQP